MMISFYKIQNQHICTNLGAQLHQEGSQDFHVDPQAIVFANILKTSFPLLHWGLSVEN
jgi:hypothetical protein